MAENEYLFIDGGYFTARFAEVVTRMFTLEQLPDFNLTAVQRQFGAQKLFYYDCLDDVARPGETAEQTSERITEQERRFAQFSALPGVHVRLGTLSGSKQKKLRQKEVDVQLAVDMLTHAFSRNMTRATLIAGDLDFRPIVHALVQLGTYVRLCYLPSSVARDLRAAADEGVEITVAMAHSWTNLEFQMVHQIPQTIEAGSHHQFADSLIRSHGTIAGHKAELRFHDGNQWFVIMMPDYPSPYRYRMIYHRDYPLLEKYVSVTEGPVHWDNPPVVRG